MKIGLEELRIILEALKTAHEEITAMEQTYDDYVSTGRLVEQLESAIELLEDLV